MYKIVHANDGVYDLFIDKNWISSTNSADRLFAFLRDKGLIEFIDISDYK